MDGKLRDGQFHGAQDAEIAAARTPVRIDLSFINLQR